ncbi:hypothetical protein NL676_021645 [Syzygium grande]|nr:hypothetical protein NL676_021645 [Syzygium grande]
MLGSVENDCRLDPRQLLAAPRRDGAWTLLRRDRRHVLSSGLEPASPPIALLGATPAAISSHGKHLQVCPSSEPGGAAAAMEGGRHHDKESVDRERARVEKENKENRDHDTVLIELSSDDTYSKRS